MYLLDYTLVMRNTVYALNSFYKNKSFSLLPQLLRSFSTDQVTSQYLLKKVLVNAIDCSPKEAGAILKKEPLQNLAVAEIESRIHNLKKFNISPPLIKDNAWLITECPKTLTEKLNILKHIPVPSSTFITLLQFSKHQIKRLRLMCINDLRYYPNENRITYLCENLKTTPDTICSIFCKRTALTRTSFRRVKEVIELLHKHEMPSKYILSDIWILQYKAEEIDKQLKKVKEAEVGYIKPWMARCQEYKIRRLVERINTKQDLLGDQSVEEYLSQRLGCSVETIKILLNHYPNISKVDIRKLKEMLDCLFFNEFTAAQILLALPRISKRSVVTVNARLAELRQLGLYPCSLFVLCKTQKEYSEFISKGCKHKSASDK